MRRFGIALACFSAIAASACSDDDGDGADSGAAGRDGVTADGSVAGDDGAGRGGASGGGAGGRRGNAGSGGAGSGGTAGDRSDAGTARDAGTDAATGEDAATPGDVECPTAEPGSGDACTGTGLCTFGAFAGCRTVWECYRGRFVEVYSDSCVGPSLDLCPGDPAQPGAVCPAVDYACVYEDGSICSCRPVSECSGVPPDPESYVFRCGLPTPAGCRGAVPQQGSACRDPGLVCGSSCCGLRWSCEGGRWNVLNVVCPP